MRIITGSARGARLLAPKGMTTRPTADRVKESVFNILGDKVRDRRVLDLFAGSGALGLESLSRGASHALMVDRDSVGIIAKNAAHTHLEHKAKILDMDVMAALSRLEKEEECFGIIFSDPPYHRGWTEAVLARITESHLLAENGILVLEHGADEEGFSSETLTCVLSRRYGAVTKVSFFQRASYLKNEM